MFNGLVIPNALRNCGHASSRCWRSIVSIPRNGCQQLKALDLIEARSPLRAWIASRAIASQFCAEEPRGWRFVRRYAPSHTPLKTANTGIEHIVSITAVHDILHDVFIPLWGFNMASTDAFALRRSGLNEFLFAPVGTEANGMTLSMVSVFARLGNDPWQEAGRLAGLPKPEATESLARIIASMPTSAWPLQAATTIATRLIALLPTQAGNLRQSSSVAAYGAKAGRMIRIGLVLMAVAYVAFQTGVFTTFDAPKPDGNSVTFAVAPR